MSIAHFRPTAQPGHACWWCTAYDGLTAGGSAALCALAGASRVRSMPELGCCSFERAVGADDEPDQWPAGYQQLAPGPRPAPAQPAPAARVPVSWAP